MKMLLAASLTAGGARLHAETFDVQTVLAVDPGKSGPVPASLAKYKVALSTSAYIKFSDAGKQAVTVSDAAPNSTCAVGKYTLEFTREAADKFAIVVKEGKKAVLAPLNYTFTKERTKQLELAAPGGMYIVFITKLKE